MSFSSLKPRSKLCREYSPALWSNRLTPKEVLVDHVKVATKESRIVHQKHTSRVLQIPTTENKIQSEESCVDIFPTNILNSSPVHHLFIFIHGGYWQLFSRSLSAFMVQHLNKQGISVGVVGYDLCPKITMYEMIKQVQLGVSQLIHKFFTHLPSSHPLVINPPQKLSIHICGHSAGGHLASMLLTDLCWLQPLYSLLPFSSSKIPFEISSFWLISGIYDLFPIVKTMVNDALKLTDKDAPVLSPISLPLQSVSFSSSISIYVLVASHDPPAFRDQSKKYFEYLVSNFQKSNLSTKNLYFEIVEGFDHFNIIEGLCNGENQISRLLINHIHKPKSRI